MKLLFVIFLTLGLLTVIAGAYFDNPEIITTHQWDEKNMRWILMDFAVLHWYEKTDLRKHGEAELTRIYFEWEDPMNPNRDRYNDGYDYPWGRVTSIKQFNDLFVYRSPEARPTKKSEIDLDRVEKFE